MQRLCLRGNNSTTPWIALSAVLVQDVSSQQSRAFYDDMFGRGAAAGNGFAWLWSHVPPCAPMYTCVSAGMASFEPDFMNQNYNCVPQ